MVWCGVCHTRIYVRETYKVKVKVPDSSLFQNKTVCYSCKIKELESKLEGLKKALLAVWENDDHVPDSDNGRCTGLDWFSQGVKDNVVAYIAIEAFGLEEARNMLDDQEITEDAPFQVKTR